MSVQFLMLMYNIMQIYHDQTGMIIPVPILCSLHNCYHSHYQCVICIIIIVIITLFRGSVKS